LADSSGLGSLCRVLPRVGPVAPPRSDAPATKVYRAFMSEKIIEIKRMNSLLERIANTLEKQQPRH
jgi:hypothetical protein